MADIRNFTINFGPQHPAAHGVLRLVLELDGEVVERADPHVGLLHRGTEKLAEHKTFLQSVPYMDRLDYVSMMCNEHAYVMAVEKLLGVDVPLRAQYIRVMFDEITRILNHLLWIGAHAIDIGAMTMFLYAFREREKVLDLFESLTGARMMCNYMRFGGCRVDLPQGWIEEAKRVVDEYPRFLDEFENLLTGNEILMARTQGVGVISGAAAVNASLTGPVLRASGIDYDIRKVDRYGIYDRFDFRIPLGDHGDVYDRYMIRTLEMRESIKILQKALREIPEGPIMDAKAKLRSFRPKPGEAYGRIESPKGELGFYLISDGSPNPYRYRVRPPSLINLTVLEEMCLGQKVADVVVILGSIDIVLGEVDR